MRASLTADAEYELIESARYYAREANAELGQAFLSEFERSVELLLEHPKFGAVWRGATRRLPLAASPFSVQHRLRAARRLSSCNCYCAPKKATRFLDSSRLKSQKVSI